MKRKLNIYCIMFIMAVAVGITINLVTGYQELLTSFAEGKKSADDEWDKQGAYKYDDVYVTFRPKSFSVGNYIGHDSIDNAKTNEREAVSYRSITVQVPSEKARPATAYSNTLLAIGSILYGIGILGFWIIFIITIRSVKRGEVFLLNVASHLMMAAIFLLVAYAAQWVFIWAAYERAIELVAIADYEIVPNYEYDNSLLYIAFGLMLLSQIIKQGKELKDDQELTI